MILHIDLHTIHGDLLVSKGVEITPGIVRRVRDMGSRLKSVSVPIKETSIFADFKKVFDDQRYANMFRSSSAKRETCDIAGGIELEDNVIFELNYMRSNLPYTYKHALIVAALAIRLSSAYKSALYNKKTVARCGFTHDIGKVRVPLNILEKREKLTPQEKKIMNSHTIMGYLLLCYYLRRDRTVCPLANLDHHERLDGSGYPRGIKKIGRYAQLISIVDILDALMTKRPYRDTTFTLRASLDYLLCQARMNRFHVDMVLPLIRLARKESAEIRDVRSMKISKEIRDEIPD